MTYSTFPSEHFKALVEYANNDFNFVANKINIVSSTDITGVPCWTIMAFQDAVNETTGSPEVNGIHIYLPKSSLKGEVDLVGGLTPPDLLQNSASYFKIVDKIPDPQKKIDTIVDYLGTGGAIKYAWSEDNKQVEGNFGFSAIDDNGQIFKVNGYFHIFNKGPHTI
ncbi:hypothetical protein [Pseudomonas sp. R2-37-08W]|uniref:hypothetical protein n=1 Tax=Pseudomonas sp. R2-37-08W TaxID=1173273 RepID=UPI000F570454|nr:hypothetical protein [Pseudomonas sp. R2-37-08W]